MVIPNCNNALNVLFINAALAVVHSITLEEWEISETFWKPKEI